MFLKKKGLFPKKMVLFFSSSACFKNRSSFLLLVSRTPCFKNSKKRSRRKTRNKKRCCLFQELKETVLSFIEEKNSKNQNFCFFVSGKKEEEGLSLFLKNCLFQEPLFLKNCLFQEPLFFSSACFKNRSKTLLVS